MIAPTGTRRMMRGVVLAWIVVLAWLLAACADETPAPDGDAPVLGDFEAMRKEIATLALTPTPTAVVAGGESVDIVEPTATPGRPQPTATLTPYVGVFLGQPTSESGEAPPTLAPYVINPGGIAAVGSSSGGAAPVGSAGDCTTPVAPQLASAYNANSTVQQKLGCPLSGALTLQMVTQPFERGHMYWRDTRQIYALANNSQFWQVADSWNEGMPPDDPNFGAPDGLLQPVRGFGLAWRSNQGLRDALGWATLPETPYSSVWQDFQGGALFVGANNQIYAIYPADGQHSGALGS